MPFGQLKLKPQALLALEIHPALIRSVHLRGRPDDVVTVPAECIPGDPVHGRQSLAEREVAVAVGEVAMIPTTWADVPEGKVPQELRFMEALEDLDDVQQVWTNFTADASRAEAG